MLPDGAAIAAALHDLQLTALTNALASAEHEPPGNRRNPPFSFRNRRRQNCSTSVRLRRRVGLLLGDKGIHDFPEGTRWGCHGDTKEPLGGVSNPACAAVEPERTLLEVAIEVFEPHRPLMGAEDPTLEQEKIR
jgi:hypothetical protein